jgi:hypothetical protein
MVCWRCVLSSVHEGLFVAYYRSLGFVFRAPGFVFNCGATMEHSSSFSGLGTLICDFVR